MSSGDILIVSALPQEMAAFRAVAPASVRCIAGGMGARCGRTVRRQLQKRPSRLVISAGFAGGLRPGFRVGDLVMASEVVEGASGARRQPSPSFGLNGMASVGSFLTVETILTQPQAKEQMGRRYGAIAVDMETASVARAAAEAGVPWVGIRAILDPMEVALPVSSGWDALRLLAVPRRWAEFRRFTKAVRAAGEALAIGLKQFLKEGS